MGFSSISVGDLARWAFWVPLRAVLNPENPQGVRGLTSAWRLRYALSGAQKGAMEAEFRLCFGETQGLVEEAYRIGVQNHLEELLGDRRLAGAVVLERELVDQLTCVLGGAVHGAHAGAHLGRDALKEHAVDLHREVPWQHRVHQLLLGGFVDELRQVVGVLHLLSRKPDLVLSGINRGPNLGEDVSYSGTVSAALEAAIIHTHTLEALHSKEILIV